MKIIVSKMIYSVESHLQSPGRTQAVPPDERPIPSFRSVLKIIAVIILSSAGVILFLSRFQPMGEGLSGIARRFFSFQADGDDINAYLDFMYEVKRTDEFGSEIIFNGAPCYSGDLIEIKYTVPARCYLTIFCVDSKGTHHLDFNGVLKDKDPLFFEDKVTRTFNIILDDTAGLEVFYFLVSREKFSFKGDVEKGMRKVFPEGNTKGPVRQAYLLDLKKSIRQFTFYISHLKRL